MFDCFGIYWTSLDNFVYLPLFLVFLGLIFNNILWIRNIIPLLVYKSNCKKIFQGFSWIKQKIKSFSLIAALVLIFLAILRPQWGKQERVVVQQGRDLLVVLDISRSMLAQDLKPSRLEFVKLKIRNLLDRLKFERLGLILFSGSAFLQCPLTNDHSAFLMFLDSVDVEAIASGTTAIDKALIKAVEVFSQFPNRKNKLVLLATDGEDFSTNLKPIEQKARSENIKLLSWGIGTTGGAPIPKVDIYGNSIGHEIDENKKIVLSKLNDEKLQYLSKFLNGSYFKATYSDSDLDSISRFIASFEREDFDDKKFSMYEDQYPLLLLIAWFLLLLDWLL